MKKIRITAFADGGVKVFETSQLFATEDGAATVEVDFTKVGITDYNKWVDIRLVNGDTLTLPAIGSPQNGDVLEFPISSALSVQGAIRIQPWASLNGSKVIFGESVFIFKSFLNNTMDTAAENPDLITQLVEEMALVQGVTATIGTVTIVEDNSFAYVTNSGTSRDVILNFGIPKGVKGDQGLQGLQGDKGDKGDTGEQGIPGVSDIPGPEGPQGPQGLKGDKGDIGSIGPKGDKGDTGSPGLTGPAGPKGDQGDAFLYNDFTELQLADLVGPEGPEGLQGEQGIQGIQGIQGETGETGLTGDTGPQGDIGPKGDPFVYTDFTALQLEDLTGPEGPQGIQGNQGIQGEAGPTGLTGETGLTGPKGDQGEQGIQGDAGYTPIKGVDYFDGEQGIQGTQGEQGTEGIQGEPGVDGVDGEGVPIGGTEGQVLAKVDGTDYNTSWVDVAAGGSNSTLIVDVNSTAITKLWSITGLNLTPLTKTYRVRCFFTGTFASADLFKIYYNTDTYGSNRSSYTMSGDIGPAGGQPYLDFLLARDNSNKPTIIGKYYNFVKDNVNKTFNLGYTGSITTITALNFNMWNADLAIGSRVIIEELSEDFYETANL